MAVYKAISHFWTSLSFLRLSTWRCRLVRGLFYGQPKRSWWRSENEVWLCYGNLFAIQKKINRSRLWMNKSTLSCCQEVNNNLRMIDDLMGWNLRHPKNSPKNFFHIDIWKRIPIPRTRKDSGSSKPFLHYTEDVNSQDSSFFDRNTAYLRVTSHGMDVLSNCAFCGGFLDLTFFWNIVDNLLVK